MVLYDKNIVWLSSYKFKTLRLGTFNKRELIWRGCVVHSQILIYNDGVADGQMHENFLETFKLCMIRLFQNLF